MSDLLAYLERVTSAPAVEQVWKELTTAMAECGFDRLIYGFTRFRTAQSFGSPEDLLILSNHERGYTEHFIGDRLYLQAPMMRWAAENSGARSWRWIAERGELTPAEARVAEFNRKMGVVAGYTLSFPALSQRAKGGMSLAARPGIDQETVDRTWEAHGRELFQMAIVAHLKIITLPFTGSRRPLTDRQREALEWVGDGKTTQDIATIMGLTAATVEKHLRLAREALDVDTTAQAVLKASFQNQIFVVPQ